MAGTTHTNRFGRDVLDHPARVREVRTAVLSWFDTNGRAIDFRASSDAYGILVGEVMAQQTQIARVEPAWRAFMSRFPTAASLAAASLGDVVRAWSGLGYNRRAVNLWQAAAGIVRDHDGHVPRTVAELQQLPGVGPYTARAVAAVAFGAPVGAVDTNVRRVLTRMLRVEGDEAAHESAAADASEGVVQRAADVLVDPIRPADWTHALMDIGATVCRSATPACERCPLRPWCGFAGTRDAPDPGVAARARRARRSTEPFEGTRRWLRGRIVERLVAAPEGEWLDVSGPIGTHSDADVRVTIDALAREALLERDASGRVRLPVGAPVSRGAGDAQRYDRLS